MDLNSKLANDVRKQMVEALATYEMLSEGDKLMVCCSGGKDSSILLTLLKEVQIHHFFQVFTVIFNLL
jgi:tRNA 2-thiocytidine biosynthesis protein TtcA